jgi:hypothetical protein
LQTVHLIKGWYAEYDTQEPNSNPPIPDLKWSYT